MVGHIDQNSALAGLMTLAADDIEKYILEVGRFTVGFATLEFALSSWVSIVWAFYRSDTAIRPSDFAFSRKVEFVRTAYENNLKLSAYAQIANDWLDGINRLKTERAFLAKGLINIEKSTPEKFHLRIMKLNGDGKAVIEKPITLVRLIKIRKQASEIGRSIIAHGIDIYPQVPKS